MSYGDHGWTCLEQDCDRAETNGLASLAFNGAEWHNTGTGHNVRVYVEQGREEWELLFEGWKRTWTAPE